MVKFKQDGRLIKVDLRDEVVTVYRDDVDITDEVPDSKIREYLYEGISIFNLERSEYLADRDV